jgi:hypothetical protein
LSFYFQCTDDSFCQLGQFCSHNSNLGFSTCHDCIVCSDYSRLNSSNQMTVCLRSPFECGDCKPGLYSEQTWKGSTEKCRPIPGNKTKSDSGTNVEISSESWYEGPIFIFSVVGALTFLLVAIIVTLCIKRKGNIQFVMDTFSQIYFNRS